MIAHQRGSIPLRAVATMPDSREPIPRTDERLHISIEMEGKVERLKRVQPPPVGGEHVFHRAEGNPGRRQKIVFVQAEIRINPCGPQWTLSHRFPGHSRTPLQVAHLLFVWFMAMFHL